MDRSRESRKAPMSRRRQRGSSHRDSPDEDGPAEVHETSRLRDRKKERERDRERSSRNKRRRGERLMQVDNRDDVAGESTDESVNDENEDEFDGGGSGSGSMRMPPPNPASTSSPSLSNHHRKSFPQGSQSTKKMFRPASPWKPVDEMIAVHVPRKARSASTKRAHECWVSGSSGLIGGDQQHRQASTSPGRSSLVSATASPLRMSPPPSNLSNQKKVKVIGSSKHRSTPKASTSKTVSSDQDEIEFEIAEVLYGMMTQPAEAAKPDGDKNTGLNKSASDSKSRASSPVSAAAAPLNSVTSFTAPKRKRPRPVNYGDETVGFPSRENCNRKSDVDPAAKAEPRPAVLEKNFKPILAVERLSPDLEKSRDEGSIKPSVMRNISAESENLRTEPTVAGVKDLDEVSIKTDPPVNRFDLKSEENSRPMESGLGIKREKKFQIDLMASPPLKLSPERDGNIQYVSSHPKKSFPNLEDLKPVVKNAAADDTRNLADLDHVRFNRELHKSSFAQERYVNLQKTLEKNDGEIVAGSAKLELHSQHQQAQQQLQRISPGDEAARERTAAGSLPSAMSASGWQGGHHMGYMTSLQGVVPLEASTLSSTPLQPPHMLLNQPRPKRCANHCYIARRIASHQQFTRMDPSFWPTAAALYGPNASNLNIVPPVPDKNLGVFPSNNTGKDKPSQASNIPDTAQRKQILLQQPLPAGVPGSLLRGPAFIFPLNQQQAVAAAASALTSTLKTPPVVAGAPPVGNPNSGPGSALPAAPATMTFNYPNMVTNETQYLAFLQNNPYQFPFPTHVGAPPVYRGAHPQAMPFFNGTFYSPQMLHPSQLQQQPQQSAHGLQVPPTQNKGISNGSSSSQKQLQQINSQNSQGNGSSAGTSNMKQSYPSPKNQPSHQPFKQHNQHLTEPGGEDSPSTADSRGSRSNFGMYTEGMNLPIHTQNFTLMSASSLSASGGTATANVVSNGNHHKNVNHLEKKPRHAQQVLKVGADSMPSHQGFAVSFASLNGNGGSPAIDISSMGQNHAMLQNFPDAVRHHNYPVMIAQQAQQNKKNFRVSEEVKKGSGTDSLIGDERQSVVNKGGLSNVGLSIAFSRSDMADSSSPGHNVVDSSSRNPTVASGPGRATGPLMSTSMTTTQQQLPHNHHQQLQQQKSQLTQLHKQPQQFMASAVRGKSASSSNGHIYLDQLPKNSAMAAKITNSLATHMSGVGSIPTQTQQWKNSAHAPISQVPSPTSGPANSLSGKNIYQQQSHMQISFGGSNPKSLPAGQGQHPSAGHSNSAQLMVGSAAAASLNHRSNGSPRNTTTAAGMVPSKSPQSTTLSQSVSLQVKNSSMPSRSSSPVGSRNVPPAPGNSSMGMAHSNSSVKPQIFQQQHVNQHHHQQQMKSQLSKQAMQQSQFSGYLHTSQVPSPTSSTTSATAAATTNSGYLQRRRPETQQSQQQSQSPSGSSSTGMLSMCSSAVTVTTDPAKAMAEAAAGGINIKAPSK